MVAILLGLNVLISIQNKDWWLLALQGLIFVSVAMFTTDFFISGIAPHGDYLVVLSFDEDKAQHKVGPSGGRNWCPQLQE